MARQGDLVVAIVREGRAARLRRGARSPDPPAMVKDHLSMKQVYTASNLLEAEFLRGLLEARGIRAVRGESLFPLRGQIPMTIDTLRRSGSRRAS